MDGAKRLALTLMWVILDTDREIDLAKPEDVAGALTSYAGYFKALAKGEAPVAVDITPKADHLIGRFEAQLAKHMELRLDEVILGDRYATLNDLYADVFADLNKVLQQFLEVDEEGVEDFLDTLEEINPPHPLNRKAFLDETGLWLNPYPIRTPPDSELLAGDARPGEAAYSGLPGDEVLKLIEQYPDRPWVVAHYILNANEDEELLRRAEKHYRPLADFPPGASGFYNDEEFMALNSCAVRIGFLKNDVPAVARCIREMMALDLEEELISGVLLTLAVMQAEQQLGGHAPTAAEDLSVPLQPVPGFPKVSEALLAQYPSVGAIMSDMMTMAQPGDEVEEFSDLIPTDWSEDLICQVKITLRDSRPPIWRRMLIPAGMPLAAVHYAIQVAFDWEDAHLHNFTVGRQTFGLPEFNFDTGNDIDYTDMALGDLVDISRKFSYIYDFGDSWEHLIEVERMEAMEVKHPLPYVEAGGRAAPPEDCGGIWGYEEYLNALRAPAGKRDPEMYEYAVLSLGEDWDPDYFDAGEINERLAELFKR